MNRCDSSRPCKRCRKLGLEQSCIDVERKNAKKRRTSTCTRTSSSSSSSSATQEQFQQLLGLLSDSFPALNARPMSSSSSTTASAESSSNVESGTQEKSESKPVRVIPHSAFISAQYLPILKRQLTEGNANVLPWLQKEFLSSTNPAAATADDNDNVEERSCGLNLESSDSNHQQKMSTQDGSSSDTLLFAAGCHHHQMDTFGIDNFARERCNSGHQRNDMALMGTDHVDFFSMEPLFYGDTMGVGFDSNTRSCSSDHSHHDSAPFNSAAAAAAATTGTIEVESVSANEHDHTLTSLSSSVDRGQFEAGQTQFIDAISDTFDIQHQLGPQFHVDNNFGPASVLAYNRKKSITSADSSVEFPSLTTSLSSKAHCIAVWMSNSYELYSCNQDFSRVFNIDPQCTVSKKASEEITAANHSFTALLQETDNSSSSSARTTSSAIPRFHQIIHEQQQSDRLLLSFFKGTTTSYSSNIGLCPLVKEFNQCSCGQGRWNLVRSGGTFIDAFMSAHHVRSSQSSKPDYFVTFITVHNVRANSPLNY